MTKFDFNEGMAMIVLGVIACGAMYYLGDAGKDIVLTVAAGIVGYISRGAKEADEKPEEKRLVIGTKENPIILKDEVKE